MSPKKIILTFLFTGVSFLLNAQNSDTLNSDSVSYRYGLIGIGPISQKITFLSPVKYSGLTFNKEIGSYKLINKKITSSFFILIKVIHQIILPVLMKMNHLLFRFYLPIPLFQLMVAIYSIEGIE